jgi:hypothetical protein
MTYEVWRITYQSSEAAARAAYNTVEKLNEENQALRKYVDGLKAALGAQVRFSVEEFEKQGMRLVNAGALQMVVNALRRDAEEGKQVRGEMADELLTAMHPQAQQAPTATDAGNPVSGAQDKMNTTQKPEALNLEEFRAKVTHAAREPLLARIAELEAQLSAIGAGGVEPLRKREAAPQAVQAVQAAVPVGTKFFSFDPCDDLVVHDTAEAACAAAQQYIDLYREDAAAEGWAEEVERVCWGMILGQALETKLSEDLPPDAFAAGVAGSLPPGDYVLQAAAQVVLPEPVPSGMRLVNAGALQMVINALRRDAEEGKVVRGELLDSTKKQRAALSSQIA